MTEHCDYHGKCKRPAYAEVYPEGSWSYLCFWHFVLARILRHKIAWWIIKEDEEHEQK
jgi:hypothetical protein